MSECADIILVTNSVHCMCETAVFLSRNLRIKVALKKNSHTHTDPDQHFSHFSFKHVFHISYQNLCHVLFYGINFAQ